MQASSVLYDSSSNSEHASALTGSTALGYMGRWSGRHS